MIVSIIVIEHTFQIAKLYINCHFLCMPKSSQHLHWPFMSVQKIVVKNFSTHFVSVADLCQWFRDHSVYVPSQCNAVSHWLAEYTEWSLMFHVQHLRFKLSQDSATKLLIAQGLANKIKCYKCNIFSHWLIPCHGLLSLARTNSSS